MTLLTFFWVFHRVQYLYLLFSSVAYVICLWNTAMEFASCADDTMPCTYGESFDEIIKKLEIDV